MADEEEDLAALAWPGFVDILSAVVIMFVFLVVIIAVTLFFYTQIFKSKIVNESQQTQSQTIAQQIEKLSSEKTALEDKIASLNEKVDMLNANLSRSLQQEVKSESREFLIFFGNDAITVTQETKDSIDDFIQRVQSETSSENLKFQIFAGKNPEAATPSIARTVSFTRLFNSRNVFLENGIPAENIEAKLVEAEFIDDTYHWVRIKVIEE